MFYTDTNGQTPQERCLALVLLEAAIETCLPYEIKIEEFNDLRADIDDLLGTDHKWIFEE